MTHKLQGMPHLIAINEVIALALARAGGDAGFVLATAAGRVVHRSGGQLEEGLRALEHAFDASERVERHTVRVVQVA